VTAPFDATPPLILETPGDRRCRHHPRPDTEGNKSTIRAYCAAIDAAQNTDALNALASVAYRSHFPGMPPMDRAATQQYGNAFYVACPGLRHTIDEIIGDGEVVAVRLTARGTHTRPFGPIQPLNRTFELPFINWYRFDHAKVIEQRVSFDSMSFLQQIGALPTPEV
jgi:predicted ester cyclase